MIEQQSKKETKIYFNVKMNQYLHFNLGHNLNLRIYLKGRIIDEVCQIVRIMRIMKRRTLTAIVKQRRKFRIMEK